MECVNFTGMTSISNQAFTRSSLVEIEVPSTVTSIGTDGFRECSKLTNVILNEGLLTMYRSFYQCAKLTSITLPSTVTALGPEVFYNSPALASVIALPETPPTVSGQWLRYNSIAKIYVPDNSVSAYKAASGWSTYASRIHGMSELPG